MRSACALGDSVNTGQAVENPLPNETEPIANLAASQSFPALRREIKVKIFKLPGHAPGILTYDRASVRLWRARSPMQVLIVSSLLETKACRKDLFDTLKRRNLRISAFFGNM